METSRHLLFLWLLASLAACSHEQVYNSMKGWQRNECNKRIDNRDREQCLKDAEQTYGDYQKERGQ